MFDIELMRVRVLEIADPNNPYTQEDFNTEFGSSLATVTVNEDYGKINLEFVNTSNNLDPEYATTGSSGFDLRANLTETVTIESGSVEIIPTGLVFNIPNNFEIQVRPRSGLAAKNGVTVLNSPGTIDADYKGELKVILINHGKVPFIINHGDRIAQAIFAPVYSMNSVKLNKVKSIMNNTERGTGGFGSTGK